MPRENTKIAIRALNSLYEVVMDIYKNTDENAPRNDYNLIKNQVHEQAITHRIAHYLENKLGLFLENNNLSIDCEYNKAFKLNTNTTATENTSNKKIITVNTNFCEGCISKQEICNGKNYFIPDIILHTRGTDDNNILTIECKRKQTIDNKDVKFDFKKLKAFTCDNGNFKYKIGLSIVFNKQHPILTYFLKETIFDEIKDLLEKQNSKNYKIRIYDNEDNKAKPIKDYIKYRAFNSEE